MKWFLVLLFWNPAAEDFQVADGWAPIPQTNYTICDDRRAYATRYLPGYVDGIEHIVECVMADNMQDAVAIAKMENNLRDPQ